MLLIYPHERAFSSHGDEPGGQRRVGGQFDRHGESAGGEKKGGETNSSALVGSVKYRGGRKERACQSESTEKWRKEANKKKKRKRTDGNRVVQVLLSRAHLDGNADKLHDLV